MRRALLAVLALLTVSTLSAATFDRLDETRILGRADLIVVATVESVASREADGLVFTDYRMRVEEVLRGTAPGNAITVSEAGGTANHRIMIVSGSASYQPGSRVVAALRARGDGTWLTAYMANGAYTLTRDGRGREIAVRSFDGDQVSLPARELLDFARGVAVRAPEPLPRTAETHGFEPVTNAVASDYTATGGSPRRPVRWEACHDPSPQCQIPFAINAYQSGVPNVAAAVDNAMEAWTDDPTSFVNILIGGVTNATAITPDGQNMLLMDNSSTPPSGVICDGALACGVAWSNDELPTHTFDGVQFYAIFEADVLFRPGAFSQKEFEAILAHEFGHGLGLRHSNEAEPKSTNAIMHVPTPTSLGAVLRDWDKEAMAEVYGAGIPCVAPAVTGVSGGGTVQYNTKTTLSATVTGSTPRTHQWYEGAFPDTSAPVGFNQATFLTPNITVERQYWLKVTNECGTANSQTITVTPTECNRPQIGTPPASQRIAPNTSVKLSVVATGTSPLTYAWYEGSAPDTAKKVGTNSSQFQTPNLTVTTNYWVRVSNACGADDSPTAVITVGTQCVPATITQHPQNATVPLGSKVAFQVVAAGDTPITFQWYEGESPDPTKPIAGATAAAYETAPFTTAGTFKYWVKATNSCGHGNSNTAIVTVTCPVASVPEIAAPPVAPSALGYKVFWKASLAVTPSFELQEATRPDFSDAKTFQVSSSDHFPIPAHTEVTKDMRFYYRVRGVASCTGQMTAYSAVTNTLVIAPLPETSTEFVIGLPEGTEETFIQDYLVPGFGASATNQDTFSITSEVPWITVFPSSGALSAGGTTVQISIHPGGVNVGSSTATLSVQRVNAVAGRIGTHGTTTSTVPFSVSLVTPVSPVPRDTAPPAGTLLIPAIAHADGIGTRFQSDIRLANAAAEAITYDISFTPSASNGTTIGKKTTLVVASNETKGLDDVVKMWFGSGVAGEAQLGTLEIRPIKLASGGIPNPQSTFASSRTYAISSTGTLGQFIPALPLSSFIGDITKDALGKISLQQIANNDRYRTNIGFTEGAGAPAQILVKLIDASNNVVKVVPFNLAPYEHRQLGWAGVFGSEVTITNGRIEVEVTSATGKVTAYASVLDNNTTDPLLVFPVQAGKFAATRYVVPGVAELNAASNFHSDMRIFNPNSAPVIVTLNYRPQRSDSTPVPAAVTRTIAPGQILAIDNVLPSLFNINASGGAVTVTTPNLTPLVITARTFSREADGGTYGQFIPAVTASDAVGVGDRALEVLQLEQSPNFRSNLGLVEVTGNAVDLELTLRPPDSKITVAVAVHLEGGEFVQFGRIFQDKGLGNVYNGRVSIKVLAGNGRVAGYGSVVDNRTEDPTYVPSQ